jgi:hypothetical protein
VLRAHVLDLGLGDVGVARGRGEELLGLVRVDVEAQLRRPAGHHDRVAEEGHLAPQRIPVDRVALEQHLGAIAEEDRLGRLVEDRGADVLRRGGRRRRARGFAEVPDDPLEQVHESLRARVDDAGLRQRLHLFRRVLERDPGRLERLRQEDAEVGHGGRPLGDVARPVADDRQDRALDRTGDRGIRRLGGLDHRRAKRAGPGARLVRQAVGEAAEELREDRARVAAGAADRLVGERLRHLVEMPLPDPRDAGRDLLEGRGEVGAGVAVGHREDVDLVEGLGALRDEVGAGDDRPGQAVAVQVGDRDQGLIVAG